MSTQHASSLLQLKESRESLGKPSTFVRSGQKLDQVRIERTIRRSKARAPAKFEAKHPSEEILAGGPDLSDALGQSLPTGIECRTPSPEPQLGHEKELCVDACGTFYPELYSFPSAGLNNPEVYNFEAPASADHQGLQDTYLDKLKLCDIATRKLWMVQYSWNIPSLPGHPAGLQDFRRRNTLLAVLEPAINDKDRLCELYLQIYAATFLKCPKLSPFVHQYVLPALERDGTRAETAALAREADNFLRMCIKSLRLSAHTVSLIASAGVLCSTHMLVDDGFQAQYENAINPALLNGSLDIDVPSGTFDRIDFDVSQGPMVDSSGAGSSPATTPFASDYGMSPLTLFDGSSPATEATIHDLNMVLARARVDRMESRLLSELNLSVSVYGSGDSASAITGLHNVATSRYCKTIGGKVLTRLAWFCLSCIHREDGMIEKAGDCLVEAVRGSVHFRDDRGEQWNEVCHLFL